MTRAAGVLVLLALLLPCAVAQAQGPFDPDAELARFGDARAWNQPWMLQPFLARAGKKLTPAERAAVVNEWSTTRPKIEARHAAAEKDPFLARVDQIRTSVAHQPFYDKLLYRVAEATRPFALFVDVPGRSEADDALRAQRIAESYAPFLKAFLAKLDAEIAPLVGKAPATSFVVWVLLDDASYARFFKEFGGGAAVLGVRAHYSPQERWAFTWSPSSTAGPEFQEGVQTLLHELTHAYLDALVPGGVSAIRSHWVNEGLPEYLACWKRGDKEVFFDPLWSQRVIETLQRVPGPHGELHVDFGDWIAAADSEALWKQAVSVARKRAGAADDELIAFLMSRFYADAYLLVLWLNETREGKYRERFREYLKAELSGKGGIDAFKASLGEVLQLPVESELEIYARDLLEKRVPWTGEATRASEAAAAAAAAAATGPQPLRFAQVRTVDELASPAVLSALSPVARRALRWNRFVAAGLRDAAGTLGATPPDAAAQATEADRALGAAVEREVQALLKILKQSGDVVLLDDALRGRVVDFDDLRVVVDQRGQRSELPRARLAPARLAFALRTNGEKSDSVRAATAVLELLGGDVKKAQDAARKVAGDGASQLNTLLADGEALLREIAAAAAIERVIQAEPSQSEQTLREAWPAARATALAKALLAPLRELAAERMAPQIALDAALAGATHGTAKVVPAGRAPDAGGPVVVELTWGFDRHEEASDFVAQPWPPLYQELEKKADRKLPESVQWMVDGGRLRPAPGGFVALPLPFAADTEIELDVVLSDELDQASFEQSSFWFGVEVEGSRDLLLFDTLQNVIGFDRGRPNVTLLASVPQLKPGMTTHANLKIGPVQTVAARGDVSGRITFKLDGLAHLVLGGVGERCWQIDKLVLRAKLPPDAAARLQREHAKRLAVQLATE